MSILLVFLNSIVSIVSDGTYPVRFFLVIGYVVAIFCAAAIGKNISAGKRERLVHAGSIGMTTGLVLLFLLTIGWQVHIFRTYDIPESSVALFVTGDDFTGTRLTHTHIGKTAIATAGSTWAHALSGRADTGRALEPYIPEALAWLFVALFGMALFGSLAVATRASGYHTNSSRIAMLALYALLAFVALEKSIDGGILSDAATFACVVLLMYIWKPSRLLYGVGYAALLQVWVLVGGYVLGLYAPIAAFTAAIERLGILLAITLVVYYGVHGRSRLVATLLAVSISVASGAFIYTHAVRDISYIRTTVGQGSYLFAYTRERNINLPRVGSIGSLTAYDASSLHPQTVAHVSDTYGLPYWYRPIYPNDCNLQARRVQGHFTVLSPTTLVDTAAEPATLASISFIPEGTTSSGWHVYKATINISPCVSRRIDAMRELVRKAGSGRTIVYDVGFSEPGL